jgi:hypothetical protein
MKILVGAKIEETVNDQLNKYAVNVKKRGLTKARIIENALKFYLKRVKIK